MKNISFKQGLFVTVAILATSIFNSCKPPKVDSALAGDAAKKVYVAPGKKDELYLFTSGGFNGQVGVYGLPSGRMLKNVPVFSQDPETGYGYSEETKPMLMTSHGYTLGMIVTTHNYRAPMDKMMAGGYSLMPTIHRVLLVWI